MTNALTLRARAIESAASVVRSMDLEELFGDALYTEADETDQLDQLMDVQRMLVVAMLRTARTKRVQS